MTMDDLERALRDALRRPSPPPGFAERVLARAEAEAAARRWWRRPAALPWAGWAVAATLVVAAAGGAFLHERQRRGEEAKEQVMTALRITEAKLELARAKVRQIGLE